MRKKLSQRLVVKVQKKIDLLERRHSERSTDLAEQIHGEDISSDQFWDSVDEIEATDDFCLRYQAAMHYLNKFLVSYGLPVHGWCYL